jgi:hypothetical protein
MNRRVHKPGAGGRDIRQRNGQEMCCSGTEHIDLMTGRARSCMFIETG